MRYPAQRKNDGDLIRFIANYVHAVALNRAMTEGYTTCEVGLDSLTSEESQDENEMSRDDWEKQIIKAFGDNGYEALVENFLRDYNTG